MLLPTRGVLLWLGSLAAKSTVAAGGLDEPSLPGDVEAIYGRMAATVDWPDQFANQVYLVEVVLPVASFYRALRERGWAEADAIRTVHTAFLATGDTQRKLFIQLLRTRLGARLFLRTLRSNWLGLTPPPANLWTVTRPAPGAVHIAVSRCYRFDAFRQLDTPEVAFIACSFEGFVMDVSPYIRLTWTGMPTGADRCQHHFELLDKASKQHVDDERYLERPLRA